MNQWTAIILATDPGKSMNSNRPKYMHEACGKALVNWVVDAAVDAGASKIIAVLGHETGEVKGLLGEDVLTVEETDDQGTDIAAMAALSETEDDYVAILCGHMPLMGAESLKQAVASAKEKTLEALFIAANPLQAPKKDTAGLYVFSFKALREALKQGKDKKASYEASLADIFALWSEKGGAVGTFTVSKEEVMEVNDRKDLAYAEAQLRRRINQRHMCQGVTMTDPERIYIDDGVRIGRDTLLLPGTMLKGSTVIGEGCSIGPETVLTDCKIGNGTTVMKTVGVKAAVGENTQVGPFAYLRPDTSVGDACRIGDFVELKNSTIGNGTKVSHLTYVGDSDVGERVNFGCGTVTVNYDGAKKYRTTIGNDVFVGCNSNLVAPVTLADGAYTAAGSTITDDVPEHTLAIARARQVLKEHWNDRRNKH